MLRSGRLSLAVLAIALLGGSCASPHTAPSENADVVLAKAVEPPPTTKTEGPTVTITVRQPTVGDRFEHTSRLQLSGQLKVGGNVLPVRNARNIHYTVEILALHEGRAVKQRVRYSRFEHIEEPPPQKLDAPVLEKDYVLERKGDALLITDDAGAPVTGGELAYLQQVWRAFGTPKRFGDALASARLRVGVSAPDLAKAYAADQNADGNLVSEMTMRLKETRGDVAFFDYSMMGMIPNLEGAVMKLSGTREISISTGELLKDRGTATIGGGGVEDGVVMTLSGRGEDTTRRL
jgi:hypothetical protein